MADVIERFMEEIEPHLIEQRRKRHKYPEIGFAEYVTTYELSEQLASKGFEQFYGTDLLTSDERMGVPEQQFLEQQEQRALDYGVPPDFLERMKGGHTGFAAVLDTGKKGPNFAYRFDIDALPIEEDDTSGHVPAQQDFRSDISGMMHACGHDGHAAVGLGLAEYLAKEKDNLRGKYTILFQPAEEGGRGAKAVVDKGWLDDADYFLSGHVGIHDLPSGTVAAATSKFLASSKINAKFSGKSAHSGLEPNAGRNALLAAASATMHLHGISRHKDGATRVNVGTLHAGSGRNIIADRALMEIETRGETNELDEYMQENALRILQASAAMFDVELEIEHMGKAISADADLEFAEIVERACTGSKRLNIVPYLPIGASEDVTYMIERVRERGGKATFMIFASPLPAGHHHPRFDYDEQALTAGLETLIRTTDHLLKEDETREKLAD
ncbi:MULTISPECIES: amidohydrolase [unclassified Planococcus (in: firmicutes)]|uniref:amidohydrolase n=1 Tax=unclassified Planococcus (in: firmicutes) TaxID=2662419 RepID=UPI000C332DE6|nr:MULTISPECIES: amidohydrolase [unclassified Planococcus (in: firmicutes)]AUD13922.1 peptidase M20 [Planococcus sp. MB-3u-03]PKG45556.1 peptidase M20 [Planococcus sp. Urea-trap-24]PKG88735.1 peptidase M20 [Planococcus sp. Urea-3u-39]PKH38547.1 peptidase M20 [Planococcus sp. MB-3u-09]